jgi:uncharacterized protein
LYNYCRLRRDNSAIDFGASPARFGLDSLKKLRARELKLDTRQESKGISDMGKVEIGQKSRLLILLVYIGILLLASHIAFGGWLPPLGQKGFWFYVGLLSLLLGSQLVTPFYTKPVDAIAYAISADVALLLINNWELWNISERIAFIIVLAYCSLVVLIAFIAILTRDASVDYLSKLANSSRIASDVLGNSRVVYSLVIVFAIYIFHRNSTVEIMSVGLASVLVVALKPLEAAFLLISKLREIWLNKSPASVIGEIAAFQTPGIVLIRQRGPENIPLGSLLLIRDPHAPPKLALTLGYTGRDEGMLLRAIELNEPMPDECILRSKTIPERFVARIDDVSVQQCKAIANVCEQSKELVGIVAPDTSIEKLYFEVIQDSDIEEGRLVETLVGTNRVLYQVVDGLTKEEVIHQKNTYGYARAQAQKVGIWDATAKKFKYCGWIPKLNAPVFLKSTDAFIPQAEVIGHFPSTNFTVNIKNIHELVTHNTAILGILGVGKSILGIELAERMIAEGIKVICLDLTNQYARELSCFFDSTAEQKNLKTIQEAGNRDQDQWQENPQEGGSLPNLTKAIRDDLSNFVKPDNKIHLKIYNPARLFATKQVNEPRSYQTGGQWQRGAALWNITPVEITRIVSEVALEIAQSLGMDENGKARICLVYEEAHSLVPEWGSVAVEGDREATNGTSRAILQGRKYGLGCLLITQRTANVTKTILNQCNTIFAMRSFDETGKTFLADYIGKEYAEKMSLLRERHAVFFGKASSCENPVLIRLNDREDFLMVFRKKYPPPDLSGLFESNEDNGNVLNAKPV